MSLQALQALFLEYATKENSPKTPEKLYEPIQYLLSLGGKQYRPIVLLASYQIFKADIEKALPASMAIELFHNFTLMHDDIMDNSPLRRGKPTVHQKYDTNTAILSGDAMLIIAYQYLQKAVLESPKALIIWNVFNRMALEVCDGQRYDIDFETQKIESIAANQYIDMISLKTAVLLGASMQIGALLAGADEKDANSLYHFGKYLGIAFQLQDDYLDAFGNPEKVGKKQGGDIVQNKKTYLVIDALKNASFENRNELMKHYQTLPESENQEKIEAVKTIFENVGSTERLKNLSWEYYEKALNAMKQVQATETQKKILIDFANMLIHREF